MTFLHLVTLLEHDESSAAIFKASEAAKEDEEDETKLQKLQHLQNVGAHNKSLLLQLLLPEGTNFQSDLEEIVTFERDFTNLNVVIVAENVTTAHTKKALIRDPS